MPEQFEQDEREGLRDAFGNYLGSEVYVCHRDWSAWGEGTMSLEDFSLAIEDDDFVESLVEVAMTHSARRSPASQQVSTVEELEALPLGALVLSDGEVYRRVEPKVAGGRLVWRCLDDANHREWEHYTSETVLWQDRSGTVTVLFRPEGGE